MIVILLAFLPFDSVTVDRVDIVEFNTFYDSSPSPSVRFAQLIAWEWNDHLREHVIVDWRMCDYQTSGNVVESIWPRTRQVGREWHIEFVDGEDGYRRLIAGEVRYSVTPFDPEVQRRHVRPVEWRRKFSKPRGQ